MTPRFELICGCMSSAKTTTLISKAFQFKSIDKSVLCLSPTIDTRTTKLISKDALLSIECCKVDTLCETLALCCAHDVVLVDEAQFFADVVEFLNKLQQCAFQGTVILSALLGDSSMKRWPSMDDVMPMMDHIQFLTAYCAVCKDGTPAPFSKCLVPKDSPILIGGENAYISVCRRHFLPTPLAVAQEPRPLYSGTSL